jgi:hypothetical protein
MQFSKASTLRRQCPLWVKSGHRVKSDQCPLYSQKRTSFTAARMSALYHKRTHAPHQTAPEAATALNSHLPNIAKYKICNFYIVTQQVLKRIVAASALLNS